MITARKARNKTHDARFRRGSDYLKEVTESIEAKIVEACTRGNFTATIPVGDPDEGEIISLIETLRAHGYRTTKISRKGGESNITVCWKEDPDNGRNGYDPYEDPAPQKED